MRPTDFALAFGVFGTITTEFGVVGVLPEIARYFNVPNSTAGWLLTSFALVVAVFGPAGAFVTRKLRRKTVLLVALALFVLSSLLGAIAPSFDVLLACRVLPAFFQSVFRAVSLATATRLSAPGSAAKAVALVLSGISFAATIGIPLSTFVAGFFSWRAAFLLSGVFNGTALCLLAAVVPDLSPVEAARQPGGPYAILADPHLLSRFGTTTLLLVGMFATYGYIADYLGRLTGFTSGRTSAVLILFGAAGLLGNWIMARALARNVLAGTGGLLALLALVHVAAFGLAASAAGMTAVLCVWGSLHAAGFLAGNVQAVEGVPPASLEAVNSFLPSFYNTGISLGTLLGGLTIKHLGIGQVPWVSAGILILGLLSTLLPRSLRSSAHIAAAGIAPQYTDQRSKERCPCTTT